MISLVCKGCGAGDLRPTGSRRDRIVVSCNNCPEKFTVTCEIKDGDTLYVADAMPEDLEAVGHVADDPWVFFSARVTMGQRTVIRMAIDLARQRTSESTIGQIREGRAMELICADFIAGWKR